VGIWITRGPDVELPEGNTIEMVTDRPIYFQESALDANAAPKEFTRSHRLPRAQAGGRGPESVAL